jgi:hypothetical protein
MKSQTEFRAMLPWYVNGSLDLQTHQRMTSELARWPIFEAELAWLRALRHQLQRDRSACNTERSDSAGLDSLMALVRGEQLGTVVPLRGPISKWVVKPGRFQVAMGLAATLVFTQAAIIGMLASQNESTELSPLAGASAVGGEHIQVTFKPETTEGQIRLALASIKGEIVAGPGALGVYTIRVAQGQGSVALERLKRKSPGIIESAVLLTAH